MIPEAIGGWFSLRARSCIKLFCVFVQLGNSYKLFRKKIVVERMIEVVGLGQYVRMYTYRSLHR